ncbi:hypothetical protein SAMN04488034_10390 [Salinimicrobium catena]|uniref:TraB/GumN family protein n=1 Tax=Salinimicrobium catena TaxID=390640 RepID=A0A1H5MSY3_9FLAO|nr:DUF5694 domain-containing protein [Salinimicrobium catena]SDL29138.1 hypothetical protein SAMN04488140_10390 [Salinimicrobium catena]SEE92469.1 hypothetical protein SAMN04488034_10390 [Salinimicrobium catena]
MRFYILLVTLFFTLQFQAQQKRTEVLTLGTFHFDFPNRDFIKTENANQIDVLNPEYQKEINLIVKKLKEFEPTIIAIEYQPSEQKKIDSLYSKYLKGEYKLERAEPQQIGFRIAKEIGATKLYCVDEWGEFNQQVNEVIFGNDSVENKKFNNYYQNEVDASIKYKPKTIFKAEGILSELIRINDPKDIQKTLGNYLIGPFKYESEKGDFFGVNFESGRWFNRNLKIFRNIQRIQTNPNDKILVIFGSGHMSVLNLLFKSSPEFELVNTNSYLQ